MTCNQCLVALFLLLAIIFVALLYDGRLGAALQGWRLAAPCYAHDGAVRRFYQKLRWAFLTASEPGLTLGWFDQLDHQPLRSFTGTNPRLALKPARVYMSVLWSGIQRARVILDTYRFIQHHGGALRDALLRHDGAVLARLSLEGRGEARIVLGHDNRFRKEGELVASLWWETVPGPVALMSFSLGQNPDGAWGCYIGCIQGGGEGRQDEIKAMTKALQGMRPTALMVFAAQEIARALGASELLGVGNEIQPHLRKHPIHVPFLHRLTFDYDALWTEAGGDRHPDGWFGLPLEAARRGHGEIKANKRAMYQRRYAMLDNMSGQICSVLSPFGPDEGPCPTTMGSARMPVATYLDGVTPEPAPGVFVHPV